MLHLQTDHPLTALLDLKILLSVTESVELFGKVLQRKAVEECCYLVALTHTPPAAEAWLAALG